MHCLLGQEIWCVYVVTSNKRTCLVLICLRHLIALAPSFDFIVSYRLESNELLIHKFCRPFSESERNQMIRYADLPLPEIFRSANGFAKESLLQTSQIWHVGSDFHHHCWLLLCQFTSHAKSHIVLSLKHLQLISQVVTGVYSAMPPPSHVLWFPSLIGRVHLSIM